MGIRQVLALLFAGCCVVGSAARAANPGPVAETVEFDTADLREVVIENTSGNITIGTTEVAKAAVKTLKKNFTENCKLTVEKTGKKLSIIMGRAKLLSTEICEGDIEVRLPAAAQKARLALALQLGSGEISISKVTAAVDFKIGSGKFFADGVFFKVDGLTGSGNVNIRGLTGDTTVKTGSGDISLQWDKSPTKGNVDLKVGSGNAVLLFPKGTKLKSSFSAARGELVNEIGDNPKSDFRVKMTAGSGNLAIKAY